MILSMYYNSLILIYVLYKSKTFKLLKLLDIVGFIVGMFLWVLFMCRSGRLTHVVIILDCLGQVSCMCCIWVELPVQRRLCLIF